MGKKKPTSSGKSFHYTAPQASAIRKALEPPGRSPWNESEWQNALHYITGRAQQAVAANAFRASHPKPARPHAIRQLQLLDKAQRRSLYAKNRTGFAHPPSISALSVTICGSASSAGNWR